MAIFIASPFLFIGCSDSDDNNNNPLFQSLQGKWKLTIITNGDGLEDTMVENGYEVELKNDHTFTSNELPGYTGGTYSVVQSPGDNIKFVFTNGSNSTVRYKYINHTFEYTLYTQGLQEIPLSTEFNFSGIQVLTRLEE